MSDRDSIEYDAVCDAIAAEQAYDIASKKSAIEQCIYLFVEGKSEEQAFRILLEERLGINFEQFGLIIANYNGIGNLNHVVRLMNKTLSYERPMIFTFDDDTPNKVPKTSHLPANAHLIKIPQFPVVNLPNGQRGGSFEESFTPNDFVEACFKTALLKGSPNIKKADFRTFFDPKQPFYAQIVKFLQAKGLSSYAPSKVEIAVHLATSCDPIPSTYTALADLIRQIRKKHPIQVKM